MRILYEPPGVWCPVVMVGEQPRPDWDGRPASVCYTPWFLRFGGRALGLTRAGYVRTFARCNIHPRPGQRLTLAQARGRAQAIRDEADYRPILAMGAEAGAAFGLDVWGVYRERVCLPHPSGLCREWNKPGAWDRARGLLRFVLAYTHTKV